MVCPHHEIRIGTTYITHSAHVDSSCECIRTRFIVFTSSETNLFERKNRRGSEYIMRECQIRIVSENSHYGKGRGMIEGMKE